MSSSTVLLGGNLSGRSEWLAQRRRLRPWPQSACLGPFPDLSCTGLASTVGEELAVASMSRPEEVKNHEDLASKLGLSELLGQGVQTLSGGESVRLALSSVAAQNVDELHIDSALEQLDQHWRPLAFDFLLEPGRQIADRQYLADNHLSSFEMGRFKDALHFPLEASQNSGSSEAIDTASAKAYICPTSAVTVSLDNVSFSYSRTSRPVLQRTSLTLQPGVLHIFSGRNGSGKTTLVKLLSGTLVPRKGSIRYGSQVFRPGKSPTRFASSAFQNPDFQWTSLTVGGDLRKAHKMGEQDTDAMSLLEAFGIPGAMAQSNPNELPFVFKKRLGTALALLAGKPWLIFDEPTLGQDRIFCAALAEWFQIALAAGAGIILISHDNFFRALFPEAKTLLFENQTIRESPG